MIEDRSYSQSGTGNTGVGVRSKTGTDCYHKYVWLPDGSAVCEKCGDRLSSQDRQPPLKTSGDWLDQLLAHGPPIVALLGGLIIIASALMQVTRSPLSRILVAALGLLLCVAASRIMYFIANNRKDPSPTYATIAISFFGMAISLLLLLVSRDNHLSGPSLYPMLIGSILGAAGGIGSALIPQLEPAIREWRMNRRERLWRVPSYCAECGERIHAHDRVCPKCRSVREVEGNCRSGLKLGVFALAIPLGIGLISGVLLAGAASNSTDEWAGLGFAIVFTFIAGILAIVGLILSIIATVKSRKGLQALENDPSSAGHSTGVAGLVLGIIALTLYSLPIAGVVITIVVTAIH